MFGLFVETLTLTNTTAVIVFIKLISYKTVYKVLLQLETLIMCT